jgi:NADH dehydrogenase/NADH:ubiquinone oxidoreductase subunit G
MPELIEGLINGRRLKTPRETTILEAARQAGETIPTLCRHDGLPGDGNCRLCLVEAGGQLVASCMFPLRADGFDVKTDTPAVRKARAFVLEMLVDRVPGSPRLLALAREYGVEPDSRFGGGQDLCIDCGRCVRACERQGASAIGLMGRGRSRAVAGPFHAPPEDCIGCLACAAVCPTGHIVFQEKDGFRAIWGREFELIKCGQCGKPFTTAGQLKRYPAGGNACPACRRSALALKISRTFTSKY